MPLWVPIILLILVGSGIGYTYWMMSRDKLVAESKIKQLDFKLLDFKKTLSDYQAAVDEKNYLQEKRDFVDSISQNQKQWIDFFEQLKAKMPKDVWLKNFQGVRSGPYNIEGNTFSYGSIGFFMIQFKSIPAIKTINLESASSNAGAGGSNTVEAIAKTFKFTGNMALSAEADASKSASGTAAAKPPVR